MRGISILFVLTLVGCSTTSAPECKVDLSAAGFVQELKYPEATQRTPAFDDYTPDSFHLGISELLDAVRRAQTTIPKVRGLFVVGPSGPLWQFNVMLLTEDDGGIRANFLAMPHARVVWKATKRLTTDELELVTAALSRATDEARVADETSVLFVEWTESGEKVRSKTVNLYADLPTELSAALDLLDRIGGDATTTYSSDLGDDVPIYRCQPPR